MRTRVGYAGGSKDKPTYRSLGDHTESLQVEFDPRILSYEKLLAVFWDEHDPHARVASTQYRSVLFTHGAQQARLAKASRQALEEERERPVTTEVRPAGTFWIAEDYHQKYRLRGDGNLLRALLGVHATDETRVRESTITARANGWLAGYGSKLEIAAEAKALGLDETARRALQKSLGRRSPVLCK